VGAVLAVTAVAGAGVVYSARSHGDSAPATSAPDAATATATVQKGDMVVSDTLDGTLGYANRAEVAGKVAGTVTSLPGKGAVAHRGQRLYAVDGQPIFLLYGKVPVYRAMTVGSEGADVLQLERNLRDMGYGDDLEIDQTYTSYTASAVRDWQDDQGLSETGEINLGAVIFQPGPVRVADHKTTVGAEIGSGQPVITGTGLGLLVSVDLPVEQRHLAKKSAKVKVTLPNGRTVSGRVTSVGTVAETTGGGEGEEEKTTFKVKIRLTKPGSVGRLDEAPVDVTFASDRRQDVLSVPVNALIALPKGGYGVVVVNDDGSRNVEVDLGVFASGRVEVSSTELRAGMKVEVPAP
jgi:peptidoglycan hydrolase-like protein with peptidoglycan-binding domain